MATAASSGDLGSRGPRCVNLCVIAIADVACVPQPLARDVHLYAGCKESYAVPMSSLNQPPCRI